MPKFSNIVETPNPKSIKVVRVEVSLINREKSARMGFEIYDPAGYGYIRNV